jgi:hypothetical protein
VKIISRILLVAGILSLPVYMHPQDDRGDKRGPDGHFHNPSTGEVQPDSCDNTAHNKHKCDCERGDMECASHPDENRDHPRSKCQTYCRPKACRCANPCDS